ncbi:MAG: flippase [Candidatus Paceibacteria bacterium]
MDENKKEDEGKSVAKGGAVSIAAIGIKKVLKFGFELILTRGLGASAYGIWVLSFSVITILRNISQMGFQHGVIKYGPEAIAKGDDRELRGTMTLGILAPAMGGILWAVLLTLFAEEISTNLFGKKELSKILEILALSIPFAASASVVGFSNRVFGRVDHDVYARLIIPYILLVFGSLVVVILGGGIKEVSWVFLLSMFGSMVSGILLLSKEYRLFAPLSETLFRRPVANYSLFLMLSGLSQILLFKVDRIMLGIYVSKSKIGIYNVAAVLASQIVVFLGGFNSLFSPRISKYYQQGRVEDIQALHTSTTKWILICALSIVGIYSYTPKFYMSLFGHEFTSGWHIMIVLSLAQLVNAAVGLSGYVLNLTNNYKIELLNSLAVTITNIILNFLLIRKWGVLGAAVATSISLFLMNISRLVQVYVFEGIYPYNKSFLYIIASFVSFFGIGWLLNRYNVWDSSPYYSPLLVFAFLSVSYLTSADSTDRHIAKSTLSIVSSKIKT